MTEPKSKRARLGRNRTADGASALSASSAAPAPAPSVEEAVEVVENQEEFTSAQDAAVATVRAAQGWAVEQEEEEAEEEEEPSTPAPSVEEAVEVVENQAEEEENQAEEEEEAEPDDDVPAAQASSAEAAEDDAEDSMGELQSMVEHLGAIQVVTASWQTNLQHTRFADTLRDDLDAFAVRLAMLTSEIQSFAWDEAEVTSAAENFLKIAKELVDEYTMFKGAMTPFESTE